MADVAEVKEVLDSLRLDEAPDTPKQKAIDMTEVKEPAEGAWETSTVRPRVVTLAESEQTAVAFDCDPRRANRLEGIVASFVEYSVSEIAWENRRYGGFIREYCPSNNITPLFPFAHAFDFQIIPAIEGKQYFLGCQSHAAIGGKDSGQITFQVNDSRYDDNSGGFVVTVLAWR